MKEGEKIVYGFKNEVLPLSKKDDIKTDSSEQKKFDDFLEQTREEQKYVDMKLLDKYFPYGRPDEMVQDLFDSKSKVDNRDKLVLIHSSFDNIADKADKQPPSTNKQEFVKILRIVNKILAFNEQI